MGKLGWLMAMGLLGAPSAFAVRVADCPASIQVESSGLRLNRSLQRILGEAAYSGNPADLEPEVTEAITQSINTIAHTAGVTRAWPLKKAKNGLCRYETGERGDIEEAELYTQNGRDKLMVQTRIGPRGILLRYDATVAAISKTEVRLVANIGNMALAVPRHPYESYQAGGRLIFIGNIANLSVTAGH